MSPGLAAELLIDLVRFYANLAYARTSTSSFGGKHGAKIAVHYGALKWFVLTAITKQNGLALDSSYMRRT